MILSSAYKHYHNKVHLFNLPVYQMLWPVTDELSGDRGIAWNWPVLSNLCADGCIMIGSTWRECDEFAGKGFFFESWGRTLSVSDINFNTACDDSVPTQFTKRHLVTEFRNIELNLCASDEFWALLELQQQFLTAFGNIIPVKTGSHSVAYVVKLVCLFD